MLILKICEYTLVKKIPTENFELKNDKMGLAKFLPQQRYPLSPTGGRPCKGMRQCYTGISIHEQNY
jgi:hypothetical protein